MGKTFIGWSFITKDMKRSALFYDPKIGVYVCHTIDQLPCTKCKEEPKRLFSNNYKRGWNDALVFFQNRKN